MIIQNINKRLNSKNKQFNLKKVFLNLKYLSLIKFLTIIMITINYKWLLKSYKSKYKIQMI